MVSGSSPRKGAKVRLITRNGYDFADRYPLIVDAIRSLPGTSCAIDGEAIVVDEEGLSVFAVKHRKDRPRPDWLVLTSSPAGRDSRYSNNSLSRESPSHAESLAGSD